MMERASRAKQAQEIRATVVVVTILSFYFGYLGQHRLIDFDEGFYLLAAKLVANGKVLYRDFLFSQTPLTPYLYGFWMFFTEFSWASARLLAAFLTALLGGLLYLQVFRLTNRRSLAIASVVIFSTTSLVVGWMLLIKTYSLSTLLLFAAYCLACRERTTRILILSGLCLALAVDSRIMVAAVLPAFLYQFRSGKAWLKWLGGFCIGLSPNLILVALDSKNYWFGNLGFHAVRTPSGLVGSQSQKIEITSKLLAIQSADGSVSFQFLFLMLAAMTLVFSGARKEYQLAFQILLCLGFVSVLPTPMFNQYFATLVPFLILCLAGLAEVCLDRGDQLGKGLLRSLVLGAGLYVFAGLIDMAHYCGVSTPWQTYDETNTGAWRMGNVRQISALVNKHSRPGDLAYSSWSGYFLESHVQPLPGTEMDFTRALSLEQRITESDRHHYRIASKAEALADVRAGKTSIVINGVGKGEDGEIQAMDAMLAASGYKLVEMTNVCGIYKRLETP